MVLGAGAHLPTRLICSQSKPLVSFLLPAERDSSPGAEVFDFGAGIGGGMDRRGQRRVGKILENDNTDHDTSIETGRPSGPRLNQHLCTYSILGTRIRMCPTTTAHIILEPKLQYDGRRTRAKITRSTERWRTATSVDLQRRLCHFRTMTSPWYTKLDDVSLAHCISLNPPT